MTRRILLVGTGAMAEAYAAVLRAQQRLFTVVGRSAETAHRFHANTGVQAVTGGIESFCQRGKAREYSEAIVAVGVESLAEATVLLLEAGMKRLLVEKPAGLNHSQIEGLADKVKTCGGEVYVAYNRRFYASTQALKRRLQVEGGVRSFVFEFTEWANEIRNLKNAEGVKENWLLANSSHVIDLAFHLGGTPEEIFTYSSGQLDWHPKAVFAGAGRSKIGALFAYHANWDAPGRWGVEVLTRDTRLILRPLETLQVQKRASVVIEALPISDDLDKKFKPGVFEQVRAFLRENDLTGSLCNLDEQVANARIYQTILYGSHQMKS